MMRRNFETELLFSMCFLIALFFNSSNSYGQIYESSTIDEYRYEQYDTLNVEIVKEYLFSGKTKQLKSVKKYDSDGFIVEQLSYEKEGRKDELRLIQLFTYDSNRTECVEVWLDPSSRNKDTTFIKDQTFDSEGKLRTKTETKSYSGQTTYFNYTYDNHGNCESITIKEDTGIKKEFFKNDYDSLGRIIRQVYTHRIGTEYERFRVYNEDGQVERNSLENGQLTEVFKYNEKGNRVSRNYSWDSTLINKEMVLMKMCAEGIDHFKYDQKGKLISIRNECSTFINKENAFFRSIGENLEYDQHGLLVRKRSVCGDCPKEYATIPFGYMFEYKFTPKKTTIHPKRN